MRRTASPRVARRQTTPASTTTRAATVFLAALLAGGTATADQTRINREMVEVYDAYAVYKMGQFEEAFSRYMALAERGNRQGMLNVGHMYAAGEGVAGDREEALRWYLRAAEAGDATAMLEVAEAHAGGMGTPVDDRLAEHWYRRAAENSNAEAQWLHGRRLYDRGEQAEGLQWIRTAARDGGNTAARQFLSDLDGGSTAGRPLEADTRTLLLATLEAIDGAALRRDAAGIVEAIDDGARIRVRLPGGGWTSMDRGALRALWQATFDGVDDYAYRRSEAEFMTTAEGVLAFSRIRENLRGGDRERRLEIRETALFRISGDQARIHQLELDIRSMD